MEQSKILVIGSLNMDWVIKIPHTLAEGETILGTFTDEVPGGKGANQAYAVASLGGSATLLGAIGTDKIGEKLIGNLNKVGVNTSHIASIPNTKSGLALIHVNDKGNNSIVVLPNANAEVSKQYIDEKQKLIEETDILMLQMEIPLETVYYAIDKAYHLNKKVILNPAPAPKFIPDEVLGKIDYITPNQTELEILSGIPAKTIEAAEKGAKVLLEKGVKNVLVTLGDQGALFVNPEQTMHIKGETVSVEDTTAAGDCFNGAFAVYLAEGRSIEEAIGFANKASAIAVTRKGAQASIPRRSELGALQN